MTSYETKTLAIVSGVLDGLRLHQRFFSNDRVQDEGTAICDILFPPLEERFRHFDTVDYKWAGDSRYD